MTSVAALCDPWEVERSGPATNTMTDNAELKQVYTPRITAIFEEDRAVVEGQRPELLPLDLQAELHLRSDRVAIAYRTWLRQLGVTFGTA